MKRLLASLALLLAACSPGDGLTATDATYRPPLGASGIGVGYVTLTSDAADRIIGVSSPQAEKIEIHATVTEGSSSSMQRLDSVALEPGKPAVFAPGGMHLMVIAPQPIKAGDATFPVEFALESGKRKTIAFRVGTGGARGN